MIYLQPSIFFCRPLIQAYNDPANTLLVPSSRYLCSIYEDSGPGQENCEQKIETNEKLEEELNNNGDCNDPHRANKRIKTSEILSSNSPLPSIDFFS